MKNTMKQMLKVTAVLFLVFQPVVLAGQYDLKEMTPEVTRALENRKARFNDLLQAKSEGLIGENNQGLLSALKGGSSLVGAENQDRQVIYRAIVEQNGFGPQGLIQVQQVFAEEQRKRARPGDFIQEPSGEWRKK